jgi:hypothetical protein
MADAVAGSWPCQLTLRRQLKSLTMLIPCWFQLITAGSLDPSSSWLGQMHFCSKPSSLCCCCCCYCCRELDLSVDPEAAVEEFDQAQREQQMAAEFAAEFDAAAKAPEQQQQQQQEEAAPAGSS